MEIVDIANKIQAETPTFWGWWIVGIVAVLSVVALMLWGYEQVGLLLSINAVVIVLMGFAGNFFLGLMHEQESDKQFGALVAERIEETYGISFAYDKAAKRGDIYSERQGRGPLTLEDWDSRKSGMSLAQSVIAEHEGELGIFVIFPDGVNKVKVYFQKTDATVGNAILLAPKR